MKFKITSKQLDGTPVVHYFNNITQEIWTDKGIPVYLDQDPRCINMIKKYSYNEEPAIINKNLRELRIQIGLNCNFGCKYCNQRHSAALNRQNHSIKLPDSIRVKNFIKLLKEQEINPERIVFWGGEPFVYYKLLKILVPALRELYPEIPFSTITNGSLISKERIDFCLEHQIALTVSHDAQAFTTYRDDKNPLDDPEIVHQLNRFIDEVKGKNNIWFSVNVVVTPENSDILKIGSYFKEKFGRTVNWHFESIAKLDCESKTIIHEFTDKNKKDLLNGMFSLGIADPNTEHTGVRDRVSFILGYLINRAPSTIKYFPCDVVNSNVLATTLEGDMLACHGASKEIFTIGHLTNLGQIRNTKAIPWKNKDNCPKCPYVLYCSGGCAISSNEDTKAACENLKLWNSGFFAPAWFILFNTTIQSIEPVDE